MTRKKSRKAPPKRKGYTVPTTFDCPFCNHQQSVECKMDRKQWIGLIHCRTCNENYHTQINALSDPVDVFSEWIDECERVNRQADEELRSQGDLSSTSKKKKVSRNTHKDEDEEDEEDEDPYGKQMYSKQRNNRYKNVDDDEEDDEAILHYKV